MKTDSYTKIVLTIIAVCLIIIVLKQVDIVPKTYATPSETILQPNINYGLVPLNEDGSIDVKIISTSNKLDVNIKEIGGYWVNGSTLPVKIK